MVFEAKAVVEEDAEELRGACGVNYASCELEVRAKVVCPETGVKM